MIKYKTSYKNNDHFNNLQNSNKNIKIERLSILSCKMINVSYDASMYVQ